MYVTDTSMDKMERTDGAVFGKTRFLINFTNGLG